MWLTGSGLDAKNADWQVSPSDIKWQEYNAISFYVYGTDSKEKSLLISKITAERSGVLSHKTTLKGGAGSPAVSTSLCCATIGSREMPSRTGSWIFP
jgi:hypothetical protein